MVSVNVVLLSQELRTANASFMNTSGDPRLLNATTNTAWSSLYITPNLVLPNNTQDYVFFQVLAADCVWREHVMT